MLRYADILHVLLKLVAILLCGDHLLHRRTEDDAPGQIVRAIELWRISATEV